jgi:hypothetical protein
LFSPASPNAGLVTESARVVVSRARQQTFLNERPPLRRR